MSDVEHSATVFSKIRLKATIDGSSVPAELEQILRFWFGVNPSAEELLECYERSFAVDQSFDAEITERFAPLLEPQCATELELHCESPQARLALIILFDQFPRNIYRAQARAFAYDSRALRHCLAGISQDQDQALSEFERVFFYLPLEHAEALEHQRACIGQFQKLLGSSAGNFRSMAQKNLKSAEDHSKIIERFGRFPHRNAALRRESTDEEMAYLARKTEHYGQA